MSTINVAATMKNIVARNAAGANKMIEMTKVNNSRKAAAAPQIAFFPERGNVAPIRNIKPTGTQHTLSPWMRSVLNKSGMKLKPRRSTRRSRRGLGKTRRSSRH